MSTKRKQKAISKIMKQLHTLKRTDDHGSYRAICSAIEELKEANQYLRDLDRGVTNGFFL